MFYIFLREREREREREHRQGRSREREREGETDRITSRVHAVSAESDMGLSPMNCEIMT